MCSRGINFNRLAESWTNVTWMWATKQDLYAKFDPAGTNAGGKAYADSLMEGARTKPHPQKKDDVAFRMYRVLSTMQEGQYNANQHYSGVKTEMNAADTKEGAAGVLQACLHAHVVSAFFDCIVGHHAMFSLHDLIQIVFPAWLHICLTL